MDCLTYTAVQDMKHEHCDINPCIDCAPFKYAVTGQGKSYGVFYGSDLLQSQAFQFARTLAQAQGSDALVEVYDQRDHPEDTSCTYTISADGKKVKNG